MSVDLEIGSIETDSFIENLAKAADVMVIADVDFGQGGLFILELDAAEIVQQGFMIQKQTLLEGREDCGGVAQFHQDLL